MGLVLRYWKFIAMALMLAAIAFLAWRLDESRKEVGGLEQRLKVSNEATRILGRQVVERDQKIEEISQSSTKAFERCEAAAANSDSTAFKRGVEVGKILGAKQQCESSPPVVPWPVPSPSQPATPTPKTP